MHYKYSPRHKSGFLYGVPPEPLHIYQLDVVALNLLTYETGLLRLIVNVTVPEEEQVGLSAFF